MIQRAKWWAVIAPALLLGLAAPAMGGRLPGDVLGLYPGMSDVEARHRLETIGEIVRGQDRAKQTWKLRDPRYGYAMIRYDAEWKLHWATAFAREGGRPVRYRDIGDVSKAVHTGQHFYTWTSPARSGPGACSVVARGAGPKYLESISILAGPMRQALIVPPHAPAEPTGDDD